MKKLFAVLLLASLVTGGAFAQLMFGVTGDLHMDTNLTSDEIVAKFQSGEGIFYGPFAEIVLGKLGFGAAGTFSFYNDGLFDKMVYDVTFYVSYHLWGGRAFLDPFVEGGLGYVAEDYANSADEAYGYLPYNPNAASLFWYGAAGLGVNLGPIGAFAKFAYNSTIAQQMEMVDENGDTVLDVYGDPVMIPYYGFWDPVLNEFSQYVPAMRVTIGAKLIL